MEDTFYRETWVEIDLDALEYNLKQIRELLPDNSQIMAVVKANAYGHGSVQVARKALESGATTLAVALLEEALTLRKTGINAPILVLSRVSPKYATLAAINNITLTFFQKEWLSEVSNLDLPKDLNVHMKWDTGMGRVGIRKEEELREILVELNQIRHIHLTGVYTHFASADSADLTYFHTQKDRFQHFLNVFEQNFKDPVTIHLGNSAAAIRFPKDMYDSIRYGISMYGLYPSHEIKEENSIDLKQVFSLHSQLIHVKKIEAGESISYGSEFKASKSIWIGTIPIGYGDGWPRKLQGADVLINGKRSPIVGRICMDQTMVHLDKEYAIGTKITLIGKQKKEMIEIDEVAKRLDTINYEIPCMINNRVPRVYVNKSKDPLE